METKQTEDKTQRRGEKEKKSALGNLILYLSLMQYYDQTCRKAPSYFIETAFRVPLSGAPHVRRHNASYHVSMSADVRSNRRFENSLAALSATSLYFKCSRDCITSPTLLFVLSSRSQMPA